MNEVVLIERYSPVNFFWKNLIEWNKLPFSVEDILRKYQGFEGNLISLLPSIQESALSDITQRYEKEKSLETRSLIYLNVSHEDVPAFIRQKAEKVGYEVGICEEGSTIYSSIFNEIMFGHLDELISWKNFLNENLLFSCTDVAEKYLFLHDKLSAQGKSVEDYTEMNIYEVWKFRDLCT